MGKKSDKRVEEKEIMVQLLGEGRSTLENAKTLGRNHRTI